jgi:peroxiredoxin
MNTEMRLLKSLMGGLCLLFLNTASYGQLNYTIKGQAGSGLRGKLFLIHRLKGKDVVDSIEVAKGTFEFKGQVSQPSVARLVINPPRVTTSQTVTDYKDFYLEAGTTSINCQDSLKYASVKGGRSTAEFADLDEVHQPMVKQMSVLAKQLMKAKQEMDDDALKTLQSRAMEISKHSKQTDSAFVKLNPDSYVAFDIWRRGHRGTIEPSIEPEFRHFSKKIQNSFEGKMIEQKLSRSKSLDVGKPAPDFTLKDTSGKAVSLSSLKGKNILLCFWYAHAGGFAQFSFNLVKVNRLMKDKNFVILAVSYDDEKLWKSTIDENSMDFINVTDVGGVSMYGLPSKEMSPVAKSYGLNSSSDLFTAYLIGPDGKILARHINLWDKELPGKISKLSVN